MIARVRETSQMPRVRSAGIWWGAEWQTVPDWAQAEIMANPYLETMQDEPMKTAETEAVKMVVPRKSARVRKV